MMGRAADDNRNSVDCNNVSWFLTNGKNCFGYAARDSGHRRLPLPPARITGIIVLSIFTPLDPYRWSALVTQTIVFPFRKISHSGKKHRNYATSQSLILPTHLKIRVSSHNV